MSKTNQGRFLSIEERIEKLRDDEDWAKQNNVQVYARKDGDWIAMDNERESGGRTMHEAIKSLRRAIG